MESLKYAFWIIMIITFSACAANGDVSVIRSYYTSGSECHENVYLQNMDYVNKATITNTRYNADSLANASDQSETSRYADSLYINSLAGMQGAGLKAEGASVDASRYLYGSSTQSVSFEYFLEAGSSPASIQTSCFNPYVRFNENIYDMVNNRYQGKLQIFDSNFFSSGKGESTGEGPSGFKDTITLNFMGKSCKIEGFLDAPATNQPYNYKWNSVSGKGEIASTYLNITDVTAYKAAGKMSLGIKGSSSGMGSTLDDKFSPTSYPAEKLSGDSSQIILYMMYKLNNTLISTEQETDAGDQT